MTRWIFILLISLTVFLFETPRISFASSSYVLPYPSVMPGGISYKLHLVLEKVLQYWYFGDFGQFTYDLKESDKYLVEAKTLFEYQQYLLGYNALLKSNTYFQQTYPHLIEAKKHGKKISQQKDLLKNAADKHIETLMIIEKDIPKSFIWTPEKGNPTDLPLHRKIRESITLRREVL